MKLSTFLALVLLLPLTSCGLHMVASQTEEFHKTYDLASGGTVRLSNVNGSITIRSWDQAKVDVKAIKKGRAHKSLQEVKIEVTSTPDSVRIETVYPSRKHRIFGDSVSVSYTVFVPRTVALDQIHSANGSITVSDVNGKIAAETTNGTIRISNSQGRFDGKTTNGSIKIMNLMGTTNAKTTNGNVEVELEQVDPKEDLHLASTNGSIRLYLPEDVDFEVQAKTTNGRVKTDFPITVQGEFKRNRLNGTIGRGGPLLNLETTNGSINLMKASAKEAKGEGRRAKGEERRARSEERRAKGEERRARSEERKER